MQRTERKSRQETIVGLDMHAIIRSPSYPLAKWISQIALSYSPFKAFKPWCDNSGVSDSTAIQARSPVLRRSFRKEFPAAVRGEGVYIWDANGNQYLDLTGSAAVNFIGHGVAEIPAAMAEQAAQLEFVHSSQFTTPVAEAYGPPSSCAQPCWMR
jgi:hypothetical protein